MRLNNIKRKEQSKKNKKDAEHYGTDEEEEDEDEDDKNEEEEAGNEEDDYSCGIKIPQTPYEFQTFDYVGQFQGGAIIFKTYEMHVLGSNDDAFIVEPPSDSEVENSKIG